MSPKRQREDSRRRNTKWRFERSAFVVCFLSVYLLGPWKTDLDSSKGREDVVFAYYYPTYSASSWTVHPLNDLPTLGSYESDNPVVATRHVTWARQNGIDGFAIPWGGQGSVGDKRLRKGLLSAENMLKLRFLLIYDPAESFGTDAGSPIDFKNETVRSSMISDLVYLRDSYFNSPNYYTIDGLPVVAIQSSRLFQNFGKDAWDAIQRAASVSIFSVGDECNLEDANFGPGDSAHVHEKLRSGIPSETTVFEAYFCFRTYLPQLVQDDDTALAYYRRVSEPQFRKWASSVPFFPTLVPEYIGWGNKPLFGTPQDCYPNRSCSKTADEKS